MRMLQLRNPCALIATSILRITRLSPGKEVGIDGKPADGGSEIDTNSVEGLPQDAKHGVQKIEAITSAWSKNMLFTAYRYVSLSFHTVMLPSSPMVDPAYSSSTSSIPQQGIMGFLTPYVTSYFQQHSLTAVTGTVSSLIGGLTKLPLAKVLDIWGRPQGFISMLCGLVFGLIVMAACNDVTTYAAKQVFY
jgi:hypothetical protein